MVERQQSNLTCMTQEEHMAIVESLATIKEHIRLTNGMHKDMKMDIRTNRWLIVGLISGIEITRYLI